MSEVKELSSRVLNMKFMQRPKEEQMKAKIRAEQQKRMKESHWVLREESTSVISLEESILFDGYTPGRRSFRGFNPLIEALTTERQAEELVSKAKKESEESDQPIESFSNMAKRPAVPAKSSRPKSSEDRARVMERMLLSSTASAKQQKKEKNRQQQQSSMKHNKPVASTKQQQRAGKHFKRP